MPFFDYLLIKTFYFAIVYEELEKTLTGLSDQMKGLKKTAIEQAKLIGAEKQVQSILSTIDRAINTDNTELLHNAVKQAVNLTKNESN